MAYSHKMLVYRLSKSKYKDILSGKGASIKGGRWNSPGIEIIYTSTSPALAMSEVAVHVTFEMMPKSYWLLEIELPDKTNIKSIEELPKDWNAFPHIVATQDIGDRFIFENEFLACKVPSAVVQKEWNILINPHHTDFKEVRIVGAEPFQLDRRLFRT